MKEYNIKRHYSTKHSASYDSIVDQLRVDKMQQLKKSLSKQQGIFHGYKDTELGAKLSFKISEAIAEKGVDEQFCFFNRHYPSPFRTECEAARKRSVSEQDDQTYFLISSKTTFSISIEQSISCSLSLSFVHLKFILKILETHNADFQLFAHPFDLVVENIPSSFQLEIIELQANVNLKRAYNENNLLTFYRSYVQFSSVQFSFISAPPHEQNNKMLRNLCLVKDGVRKRKKQQNELTL